MRNIILVILLFLFLPGVSQVKNIGTPSIINYTKTVYNGGTQNWDISQDENGFMYFANNSGILRFDGFNWDFLDTDIPLPVRSVFVGSNNEIFVGLIDNFGILQLDSSGKYRFKSFRHLFDSSVGFSDVWKIYETKHGVVFQAYEKLFIYNGETIKVYSPNKKYKFSFEVNGRLLVQEPELGLYEYFGGYFEKVPWADAIKDVEIVSILEQGDNKLFICTADGLLRYNNGRLTEWSCPLNDFLKVNKLFSATSILGNYIAIGTILNGLVISDFDGNIVQVLNRENGVRNNTVLSLFADRDRNLWLGLDNGIDYVQINSPLSFISQGGEIGTGYCCVIHNGQLYLGTNQGLFAKPFNRFSKTNEDFKLIKGTEGQVWSLSVYNNQLICGHNFGTFIIENREATKIDDEPGGWRYVPLKNDPNTLVAGFYFGVSIFKFMDNQWQFYKKLNGFEESSRFITEDDNGFIWISHGAKGVFRLSLNDKLDSIKEYKLYSVNEGLPSGEQNILMSFKDKACVSTIDGIYQYNSNTDRFDRSDKITDLFDDIGRLKTLNTDSNGNLWIIGNKKSGVLRLNEDQTYTRITAPFETLKGKFVESYEFVYPYSNNHIFYGIDNGFAHYSSKFSKSYAQDFEAFITKVEISNLDSLIRPQNISKGQQFEFPFKRNSFRFHYSSPFYENITDLKFSYKLEHYSVDWSGWTSDSYKDFTNLNEGEYHFKVKARNVYGTESEIAEFSFRVIPPWFRSDVAYYIYLFLIAILTFFVIKFILYRINLAKKREAQKHEKEIKEQEELFQHQAVVAEKEIIKLRNDKLRTEMIHRNKELANQTNSIIQKNKFLMRLNQELQKIQNTTDDGALKSKMVILKKRIDKEIDSEQQNRIFETYFDEVHNAFFERLKKRYPQLSPKDLRLCAYIRMNISTKEIATLLNISDRGVEISRYRLRKKLELSREINLSTFLAGI